MQPPRLSRLEFQIMEVLWNRGSASVREIQETFPEQNRPAYTTVQTMVYRLEAKKAIRRARKVSQAHIFEPTITREAAQRRLVDEFFAFFGGRTQPVMAYLVESGRLTIEDLEKAEQALRRLARKEKSR